MSARSFSVAWTRLDSQINPLEVLGRVFGDYSANQSYADNCCSTAVQCFVEANQAGWLDLKDTMHVPGPVDKVAGVFMTTYRMAIMNMLGVPVTGLTVAAYTFEAVSVLWGGSSLEQIDQQTDRLEAVVNRRQEMLKKLLPTVHETEALIAIILPLLQKSKGEAAPVDSAHQAALKEVLEFMQQRLTPQPGAEQNLKTVIEIMDRSRQGLVKLEARKKKIEELNQALRAEREELAKLEQKDRLFRQFETVQAGDLEVHADALDAQLALQQKGTHGSHISSSFEGVIPTVVS
jgi:hypothetical protein